jgi:hypothetical protein
VHYFIIVNYLFASHFYTVTWWYKLKVSPMANNGTVCTDKRDGWPYGVQMVTPTEKLTNLKYELLLAYLDRDIDFLGELSLLDPTFSTKSYFRISSWNFIHMKVLMRLACGKNFRVFGHTLSAIWISKHICTFL